MKNFKQILFSVIFLFILANVGLGQYSVNFEGAGETKTAYASGTVSLSGLDWNMTEILIGTDANDWKNGLRSARLRGYSTSVMTMLANKANGAGTISFNYRRYGTDVQVTWKVEISTNDGANWSQVGSDFTAPANNDVQIFSQAVNITGNIRIRIIHASGGTSSNRRLNIDDILITDYIGSTPTITTTGTLAAFSTVLGTPSAQQNYTVAGSNLTADISINAPSNFEISTNSGSGFGSLVTLTQTGGTVSTTTIYARYNPAAAGSHNGNITHTSTGATQKDVAVSGTSIESEPTTQASEIVFSNVEQTTMTISWTNGNGSSRAVFVTGGTTGSAVPVDGTTYIGDPVAGNGTEIGSTGWVCVYNGTGTTVNITNLPIDTDIRAMVCEYNGSGATSNYNVNISTNNPKTQRTKPATSPTITVVGTMAQFGVVAVGSISSVEDFYYVSGSALEDDITINAPTHFEISLTSGSGFANQLILPETGGTVDQTTIYVHFKPTTTGNFNGSLIANLSANATTVNVTADGIGIAVEPTIQASVVNFTDVQTAQFTINWTIGNGSNRLVLIKQGSPVDANPQDQSSYTADPVFGNGNQIGTGNFVVYNGTGNSVIVTGLTSNTTYNVAVFEFNGSGEFVNYLINTPATGNQTTVEILPVLTEVFLPQYIQGLNGTNGTRVPFAYLATLSNLSPNATYRYFNQVVIASDLQTANGAGNVIFINTSGGNFIKSTGPSMSTAGNYGEFTTDGSGSYTGWFITEPTGNVRFTPGNDILMRIMLNNGSGGTTVVSRATTTNTVKVVNFGNTASANECTALYGITTPTAIQKNFVLLFDNETGTGRPISGTFIEADGTAAASFATFYVDNVNEQEGRYGTIIPNILPNGIRRIEQRSLFVAATDAPGDIIGFETDADGVWGAVSTVNPTGGTTALAVANGPLPVTLSSFNSNITGRNIKLSWVTDMELNNAGFDVERAEVRSQNLEFSKIGFINGHGTANTPTNYSFEDKNLNSGKYKYRLKQIDHNGNYEYFELNGEVEVGVPNKFDMSQNYPNPFNPVTKINFDLPENGLVNIRLYDMLGREVAVIVNEVRNAGYHTVQFDASKLSSGVYFYKMNAGKFSGIKKMAIVK